MGRKLVSIVFAIVMMVLGVFQIVRGWREAQDLDDGGLLERALPVPTASRAWEACPPDEIAYATSRPASVPIAGVDVAAPWTPSQRIAASTATFPATLAAGVAPRDCSPTSGPAFRRLATADDFLAIAADESATTTARAAAISELSGSVQTLIPVYCGDATIDDYQWECARVFGSQLRIGSALLALSERVAHDDPSVAGRTHWVHGLGEMRSGIAAMADSMLRILELPAGVRPPVRALFAHVLAEDHPPARAFVTDTARLAPLRARLEALAARETQPEVREALALALTRWP